MNWNVLDPRFIQAMVQAMYTYEADQINDPNLLTDAEMESFYCSYIYICE